MSYKYHERAIVNNERNLIRVFDVCFDGYCGGNDARIMRWTTDDVSEFQRASVDLTTPYSGLSFVVMSLPQYRNVEYASSAEEREDMGRKRLNICRKKQWHIFKLQGVKRK
jgi:hypothetical protein